MAGINYHRVARALVDAEMTTDKAAAERAGVHVNTIKLWRKRLDTDAALSEVFLQKRRMADRAWLAKAPPMIEDALGYMRRCTTAEPSPEMLRAIAGAVKLVSEAIASREIIDARIHKAMGELGARTGQVVPISGRSRRTG